MIHPHSTLLFLATAPMFWNQQGTTTTAFHSSQLVSIDARTGARSALSSGRRFVSSTWREPEYDSGEKQIRAAVSNITSSYMESMSMETDEEEAEVQQRLDQRNKAFASSGRRDSFRVPFNFEEGFGLSLVQVSAGRKLSSKTFDLDQLISSEKTDSNAEDDSQQQQTMDWPTVAGRLNPEFKGLLVSSVAQGSRAWQGGVRAGDVLVSSSATIGDAVWPTSSMDGLQSALRSRKVTSSNIALEFARAMSLDQEATNRYQLTLQRPLGIEVQEQITKDGDAVVVVTGFSVNAPNLVRHAVQIGDRVVAVDSSLGGSLWPVTTVAGLTSACTSRLPGAPVTLQFERPLENLQTEIEYSDVQQGVSVTPAASRAVSLQKEKAATTTEAVSVTSQSDAEALLKRCRDVLQRYSVQAKETSPGAAGFRGKYEVPAIVADKVVDALASARVSLDSVTLSMLMKAYLSCNRADSALRVFEAAVGFRSDGSCLGRVESLIGGNGGGFVPRESALNLYTGTALLQAHAMKGDLYSVSRVLAALEGRSGVLVNGLESAPWPFTGAFGSIQPDTKCYNIAIAAAAKVGGEEGLEMALALFDTMANTDVGSSKSGKPVRNAVSYNTVINALSNAGRSMEAFKLFGRMKDFRIKATKYTYTPLIKACFDDDDIEEIKYDMKESNIKFDTTVYNTMIRSLCEQRRWTEASKLVTEMESQGVAPDAMTYGFLMSAMLKANKPTACLTLFESAGASSTTSSITDNAYLYTIAITAASRLKDFERAIELLSRMAAKGVKPNLKTLTAVAGACLAADQYDLAAQIYDKIEDPDGYAMCQGVEALSGTGAFSDALKILQSQKGKSQVMTGKHIMKSYKTIIVDSLKSRDLVNAEATFANLLRQGFIPNKGMLEAICDALGFSERRGLISFAIDDDEERAPIFRFMLFVLDSLRARKLPVDSFFYSVVLFLGRSMGGNARSVAALIASAKVSEREQQLLSNEGSSKSTPKAGEHAPSNHHPAESWVHLFEDFDEFDLSAIAADLSLLPPVQLRTSSRDRRRLVRAEKEVAFALKKNGKSSRRKALLTTTA
mmetsp:Transcript_2856/g.8006  ORF Transcript_2856/g.8006 Transcript_2856/m.8006 type:complete len:1071 (+) Transcript_2856:141-3353(+)